MQDTLTNTIASGRIAENHSSHANIVALVDGTSPQPDSFLIDLTNGQRDLGVGYLPNEQNMGDGQTLVNFMAWVKARQARHTMLSIVDLRRGWAVSATRASLPVLQPGSRYWLPAAAV
ncbi:MAG: hypothetical protein U0X20_17680 [Caldilineaceae bacterium]